MNGGVEGGGVLTGSMVLVASAPIEVRTGTETGLFFYISVLFLYYSGSFITGSWVREFGIERYTGVY